MKKKKGSPVLYHMRAVFVYVCVTSLHFGIKINHWWWVGWFVLRRKNPSNGCHHLDQFFWKLKINNPSTVLALREVLSVFSLSFYSSAKKKNEEEVSINCRNIQDNTDRFIKQLPPSVCIWKKKKTTVTTKHFTSNFHFKLLFFKKNFKFFNKSINQY